MTQFVEAALRPTWCEIDLSAVTANIASIREMIGSETTLCVCVKGDASGCGDVAIALAAEAAGATSIAFGNVERAFAVRKAGLRLPILLYPCCLPDAAPMLEAAGMMPTLSTLEDVELWSRAALALPVFLKLDGGGFRAGALPADAVTVARAIAESGKLRLAGVYGHPLMTYGTPDPLYTAAQVNSCKRMMAGIEAAGIATPVRIISSSELLLNDPSSDLNGVDPGRLVLGIDFPAAAPRQRSWRPALVGLRSRLVMTKRLADVSGVTPAPFMQLRSNMRIGLIPYGLSDGFPRTMPERAEVLVRGRRVRLLAPSHSELLRVDLTDVPEAMIGDDVVLLGRDGEEEITLGDLAAQWNTLPSSLPAIIGRTLRRVYLN